MAINVGSKQWWEKFVTTALDDAGQYLEAVPDTGLRDKALADNQIDSSVRPVIVNYTDRSWNWDFSSRTTHVHTQERPETKTKETLEDKKKREKEEAETRAKVTGTAALVGALGIFGWAYRQYERHQKTVLYTGEVFNQLQAKREGSAALNKDDLLQLVFRLKEIDTLSRDKMRGYVWEAGIAAVGGVTLLLAGFRVTPLWTKNVGYLALIAAAAAWAFTAAYHWSDGAEIKKHYQVILGHTIQEKRYQGLAYMILTQLASLNEDLTITIGRDSLDTLPHLYPACHYPDGQNPPHLPIPSAPPAKC